ncbi:sulfotransferase [Streptomyces sp. S.PNR 29]|uniref:sulfotransferase family protein n=1 Tax=Streptomyces sp. S.PNR 29 TaxID=2973805 RepID=UPI0025AF158F|nr:sulfotransferase [Streptomyces sp. S.PNR 29]MDN0198681.1 sulfotransferase [Streptomyces sp. S.PNR 29]
MAMMERLELNAVNDVCDRSSVRLVESPVFVISTVRSGSTLLRCVLNAHSELHAGHELHLGDLQVRLDTDPAVTAMSALGISSAELEYLLWDRLLDRQLKNSGKNVLVEKTPGNAYIWKRIAECWPQARYIFLLRHPLHVLESLVEVIREGATEEQLAVGDADEVAARLKRAALRMLVPMIEAVIEARDNLPGITVRYEDLTAHPRIVTQRICEFLDVPWEAGMLDYGSREQGPYQMFLGDWHEKILSGVIQPHRELPSADDVPEELLAYCKAFAYLP